MATTIITKNSSTASAVPLAADLVQGELAVNVTDKRLFTQNASDVVVELGTNPSTITTTTVNGLTVGKGAGSVATNTAVGASALAANTTGAGNTAVGAQALITNTTSSFSTAVGLNALNLSTGTQNTAIGAYSQYVATTAAYNSSLGTNALSNVTTGSSNVGVGASALYSNTTASNNTAVGYQAAYANTTGLGNTFVGYQSGLNKTTGDFNTVVGDQAFKVNVGGSNNTMVGVGAGYASSGSNNTFVGARGTTTNGCGELMTTGSKNTIIGSYNGNQGGLDIRTASNYIVLSDGDGNPRLWHSGSFLACPTVYSVTTASTPNVFVDSAGGIYRGGVSALKYKQDIRDLEEININLIRAVRYKSKCEIDDQTKDYFGVVADAVAEAGIEELVTRNADGEVEGFQYERLTVVLLKKLQVLEAKVTALENQ
jgi:hypothetical protein